MNSLISNTHIDRDSVLANRYHTLVLQ